MIPCKLAPLILTLTAIIAIALSAVPSVRDSQAVLHNPLGNDSVIPPKPAGNDQDILAVLYWFNNTDKNCTGSGTEYILTADACQILPSYVVELKRTICAQGRSLSTLMNSSLCAKQVALLIL